MFFIELLNQFIFFSNDSTILAILWIFAIVFQHNNSIQLIQLLCATLIVNIWLKHLWLIPLPYQSTTFAFPSGHMHSATICYMYLFFITQYKSIKALLILILAGIAFAEINLGYHNVADISGGIGFGLLHLILYIYSTKHYGNIKTTLYIILLSAPMVWTFYTKFSFIFDCWLILIVNYLMMALLTLKTVSKKLTFKHNYLVLASSLTLISIFAYCKTYYTLPLISLPLYFAYLILVLTPYIIFSPARLKELI